MSKRKSPKWAVRLRRHPRTGQLHAFPLIGVTIPAPMSVEDVAREFGEAPARLVVDASVLRGRVADGKALIPGLAGTYVIDGYRPETMGAFVAVRESPNE